MDFYSVEEQPSLIYSHKDFYITYKPAGWLCHATLSHSANKAPKLIDFFENRLQEKLHTIHRIDRETSGIIILARNKKTANYFKSLFEHKLVAKKYILIVFGVPTSNFIQRSLLGTLGIGAANKIQLKQGSIPDGKEAITKFEVLESKKNFSLIKAIPFTGRTHQIRAQIYEAGYPMVGDKIYGIDKNAFLEFRQNGQTKALTEKLKMSRQALHSYKIGFFWQQNWYKFECNIPKDMQDFWSSI